jgi:hypothetical protein
MLRVVKKGERSAFGLHVEESFALEEAVFTPSVKKNHPTGTLDGEGRVVDNLWINESFFHRDRNKKTAVFRPSCCFSVSGG